MAQLQSTDIEGNLTVTGLLVNNNIDLLAKINSDYTKFTNMFCKAYSLPFTTTVGTNYTEEGTPEVVLIGNRLRIKAYYIRSSATANGNIANETVVTFRINHGGKFKALYDTCGVNYYSGSFATYSTSSSTVSDTVMDVKIRLNTTSAAMTYMRTWLLLTPVLDPAYF